MSADSDVQFTGKYEADGIGARLINNFYGAVGDLLSPAVAPGVTVLEVGCGAGYSTERLRARLPAGAYLYASDIGASLLKKAQVRNPETPTLRQSVYDLALPDKAVDVLVMMEVLEHLDKPEEALKELARVSRQYVLISTPREPLWRALNMMRGKYLSDLGNTPGHVQHWSSSGLGRAVSPWFEVIAVRRPIPWTILLLRPLQ